MTFTKVEVPGLKKYNKVSIKPYFDSAKENMGLENYGLSLHEGVNHTEQLACIEKNGIKRYVTGLNEFAPEIKLMEDQEAKAAKIKEIRTVVSDLEKEFAANVVDPEDEDFWSKLEVMRPDNDEFWSKIDLKAGNETQNLDPARDPYDLIKLYAIDAGGFSIIAKNYESAQQAAHSPKFYLDRFEETITTKNSLRKIRNRALSELQKMYDKESVKLLYITKVIDPGSPQYKKSTSNDTLYEVMDNYVNGMSFERDKKKAAQYFLDCARLSAGELKLRALVRDAAYYGVISPKADGYIYHVETSSLLGKNTQEVIEHLKNPLNEGTLVEVQNVVEGEWNK